MLQLPRQLYGVGRQLQSSAAGSTLVGCTTATYSTTFSWQHQPHRTGHSAPVTAAPTRTALYDFHVRNGGKMVDFGGALLPVQYSDLSLTASHVHTRRHGSIFDVSHMLQSWLRGSDVAHCMESICTADIAGAAPGTAMLTVFTNASNGGILDDLIVTKVDERTLYVVSNAAMQQQDMQLMSAAVSKHSADGRDVSIEFMSPQRQSLIALQGPKAVRTLAQLLPAERRRSLEQLYFMHMLECEVAGVPGCIITRCGYTGEDGVEISVASPRVQYVTEALLQQQCDGEKLRMAGLGARDSLRLEAGLCLYGSDISVDTTPVEAGLSWLLAKRRRQAADFPGANKILPQLQQHGAGVQRRRIGLQMLGTQVPPARAGVEIYQKGEPVGHVTSGCPSPTLGKNIAMGYIREDLKRVGNRVQLKIRDKLYEAEVVAMPFVKANYYTKPKQ